MGPPNESDWIRDVKSGDREACARLVREHHAQVYRLLLHLTHDVHLAEDLTQETFAALWRQIDGFEGRASLGTWLHRIAYNKFVDACRGAERNATLRKRIERQLREPEGLSPMDGLLADERSRQLYRAVARLEASDRDLIVLHYFQDMSYREMAEVLDEPSGTVKWRTSRALGRLRSILSDESFRETRPKPTDGRVRPRVAGDRAAPSAETDGTAGA